MIDSALVGANTLAKQDQTLRSRGKTHGDAACCHRAYESFTCVMLDKTRIQANNDGSKHLLSAYIVRSLSPGRSGVEDNVIAI